MGFTDIHIQNLENSTSNKNTHSLDETDKDKTATAKPDQEILESIEPLYFSEEADCKRHEIEVIIVLYFWKVVFFHIVVLFHRNCSSTVKL